MATLFLDFENGNDDHAGTSFATLADGTDGRYVSGTGLFTSATANFPNDGSLIGQYLSIFNGAIYSTFNITEWVSSTSLRIEAISGGTPLSTQSVDRQYYIGGRWKNFVQGATAQRTVPGDTIRIMGSPAPTSLGQNGVWTSQALQATKTLTAATNATPVAITITGHGYSTGDTVVVTGVGGNTAANGTWEITVTDADTFTLDGSAGNGARTSGGTVRLRNNTRVMLTSAVTQNIASTGPGRSAWTSADGANVTPSLTTIAANIKEHAVSDLIRIESGFTTGLAAYWPTGTLDLSGFQQVSFWINQGGSGTVPAAGDIDLRLCSDAAGVTAVNTISIPAIPVRGRWMPVTVDLGTALGSSIQSIALYVNTDKGTQDFIFSNIIACKASSEPDSLTLTSLIGKNTTGETFWGIQSINGTRVMLDADTNATPAVASVRGYYGTSETVTTWKRETIKLGPAASSTTSLQAIQESGTDGSPITYSGGWDRTAMSTQNLETWLDGVNGNGYGVSNQDKSYISMENLAAVRFNFGIAQTQSYTAINLNWNLIAANNCTAGVAAKCSGITLVVNSCVANNNGVDADEVASRKNITCLNASSNSTSGVRIAPVNGDRLKCVAYNNGSMGITATNVFPNYFAGGGLFIYNSITADNETAGLRTSSNSFPLYGQNVEIRDVTETNLTTTFALYPSAFSSQNHDNVQNNHKIFLINGLISSATDQRKTPSGISWKMQPTSTNRNSFWPLPLSLAKVACAANSLVTIKAWMRRSNTGLTMRLVCKGGQIAGVDTDVVDAMTAAADTWAEQTITFTPTEVGVVEITAEAFGGTTHSGWVDDLTISQA